MTQSVATLAAQTESLSCVMCGLALPLRHPGEGEQASKWVCVECGALYDAVFLDQAPREITTNALRHQPEPSPPPSKPAPRRTATTASAPRKPQECNRHTAVSKSVDRAANDVRNLAVHNKGPAFSDSVTKHGAVPYSTEEVALQTGLVRNSLTHIDQLVETLERGDSIDREAHQTVARQTIQQATRDLDLFVKLGIDPQNKGYPGAHSLHVAMLAVGVGANMGWDQQSLVDLGVGCLIHDLGMLRVSDSVHEQPRMLNDSEFGAILSHPLETFELLEDHISTVPLISRMVAYQIHERLDGTGYPRRRAAQGIHQAAKVAALADVYIALVSPRPHRDPMLPYHAMMHLVYGTQSGQFDPLAIRALLRTVSLFPIGSWVKLNDSRVARVLRSSPTDYTKPIIEAWRKDEIDAPPAIIDLSRDQSIRIVRPIEEVAA